MKAFALGMIAAVAWSLSTPGIVAAKGGGGHGGGGHASGGHSSGGHASGGQASGGHASGGHESRGSRSGGAVTRGTSTSLSSVTETASGRPRGGRPPVGTAVPRGATPTQPAPVLVPSRIWPYAGGGLGLGYFYDPFAWNYFGGWPGSPLGYAGYAGDGFTDDPFNTDGPTGRLRLNVEPADAEVFVDGYYAGIVDDFNGHFQHMNLTPGPHRVEVRAAGYEPLVVDVSVQPRHGTVYRGALMRARP
jgi:hypothetical protein